MKGREPLLFVSKSTGIHHIVWRTVIHSHVGPFALKDHRNTMMNIDDSIAAHITLERE